MGLFISMLLIHWFADFVCQTHEQAVNKSSSWRYLCLHTFTYSAIWVGAATLYCAYTGNTAENSILTGLAFGAITFIVHTITDYITSREVKKLFDKDDYHNGFVVIGFDQILHYVQLILTYLFLIHEGLRINI